MITITKGRKVQGTNPTTGRPKSAKGTGTVVRVIDGNSPEAGFHGTVTVIRWTNGVESYHSADLDSSNIQGL